MNKEIFSLKDKVVLLTGGMGLIGRAVADALSNAGAAVALTDIHPQPALASASAEVARLGGRCEAFQADVADRGSVQRLVSSVADRFGRLDVLIHLAAIDAKFDKNQKAAPSGFGEFPLDLWEQSVRVNMTGTFLVVQAAAEAMAKAKRGNIITVASTYSLVAPNQALYEAEGAEKVFKPVDYVATKSFIPNFTRYVATFYGKQGIRANCIVPHGIANNHPAWFVKNFERFSPLGRMCRLDEIQGPFVFLASDASSYMTGSTLVVDGGWTAW